MSDQDELISDHSYQAPETGMRCAYQYPAAPYEDGRPGEPYRCWARASEHANQDDPISDHPFEGDPSGGCAYVYRDPIEPEVCGVPASEHAVPGPSIHHLINTHPHEFVPQEQHPSACAFFVKEERPGRREPGTRVCGYIESEHHVTRSTSAVVRLADVAQYARAPMPDAARAGVVVTLIDAPTDPLGTLAVLSGIYSGRVARSKAEVTDEQRRTAWDDMMKTVLSGPLEAMQFTFLIEGVDRAITHQLVRNRFAFVAQESLRFAVAEDWAQEIPLPPSLAGMADDAPAVMLWRRGLNEAEDRYAALVAAGMPAEEARGLLPHAITTRLYVTWSMRSLLMEAGKRTCTQAQFPWRQLMAGVAKALREQAGSSARNVGALDGDDDGWQYRLFAQAIRPVCYQAGKCTFMASMDRGCTIRERVNAFERNGVPSSEWEVPYGKERGTQAEVLRHINPAEWAADPAAARVVGES